MANKLQILISAQDKASAVIKHVNQSFALLNRPVAQMKALASTLGKETGFDKVGKAIADIGRAASDAGQSLATMGGPMGVLVGAGSVAGIATLTAEWAKFGMELRNVSSITGVSTDNLQLLEGAARRVGSSSGAMNGSLRALGNTMQDALYGRNQQALLLMNKLGVSIRHTASGAVDSVSAFNQLADAIARQKNPQTQALIARTFGIDESLIPLLQRGRQGIAALEEQVRRTGVVMGGPAAAQASAFRQRLVDLGDAFGGVGNAIASKVEPVLMPLVTGLTSLIEKHQDLVAGISIAAAALGTIKTGFVILRVAAIAGLIPSLETLATMFTTVGAAMMATPVGWIVGAAALIGVAVYEIYKHWDGLKGYFKDLWDGVVRVFQSAWQTIKPLVDPIITAASFIGSKLGLGGGASAAPAAPPVAAAAPPVAAAGQPVTASASAAPAPAPGGAATEIVVTFEGAPHGMRAEVRGSGPGGPPVRIRYSMPTTVTP